MLKNTRHEHFASLIAKGVTTAEAAVTAGFSSARAIVTGSELLARPDIKARISELNVIVAERITEKIGVDKAWVMAQLVEVVQMGKAVEPVRDAEGNPTGEYKQNLAAANKALELIGKEFAMFIDRKEIRSGPLDGLGHDELKAINDALTTLATTFEPVTSGKGATRH